MRVVNMDLRIVGGGLLVGSRNVRTLHIHGVRTTDDTTIGDRQSLGVEVHAPDFPHIGSLLRLLLALRDAHAPDFAQIGYLGGCWR